MGATSFAVLRVPGGERVVHDREHLMAAIGPEETFERDAAVWLDIRGDRYCLFDPESGRAITRIEAGARRGGALATIPEIVDVSLGGEPPSELSGP
jgi:hypothetical protein